MLTIQQLQTLKAAITGDAELNALFTRFDFNSDHAAAIAEALNQIASPDFVVWKTDVPTKDCKKAMVWTEYIARSAGERDAWQFLLSNGTINAGDANVRQGIADIFSGPGGATTRANLLAIAKRSATRAEKVFASGTGSDVSPATMSFEGSLHYSEVERARGV